MANTYYIDDIGRFSDMSFNWMKDGRPLMQLMGKCLGYGTPYLDIFPLGQLLAVTILNYSLVLWGRKYIVLQSSLIMACILALAYLNLFMLEAFSYVFESIGMTISLCIPIVLYALTGKTTSPKGMLLITAIALIVSLSFYQAALGAFVGLAMIELCFELFRGSSQRYMALQFGGRLLGIAVGVVIYFFGIAHFLVNGYGAEHSSILPIGTYDGVYQLLHHCLIYFERYSIYFKSVHPLANTILIIVYLTGTILFIKKLYKDGSTGKIVKIVYFILVITLPLFLIVVAVVPFAFLKSPVFAPRTFLSFTIFFLYIAILFSHIRLGRRYVDLLLVPLLLFVLSFSMGYGNIIHRESLHDQYIAQSIAYDINQLENRQNKKYNKITFIGKETPSLELQKQEKKRPLYSLLIPIYMNNNWFWGEQYLNHYRNLKVKLILRTKKDDEWIATHKPDTRNEFYDVYANNDKVIIRFNERYH